MCPLSGSFSLSESALRESFHITVVYFSAITFRTRLSFSKGQLNTRTDLSLASTLQKISNVRGFTEDVFLGEYFGVVKFSCRGGSFSVNYSRLGAAAGGGGLLICEIVLNSKR